MSRPTLTVQSNKNKDEKSVCHCLMNHEDSRQTISNAPSRLRVITQALISSSSRNRLICLEVNILDQELYVSVRVE